MSLGDYRHRSQIKQGHRKLFQDRHRLSADEMGMSAISEDRVKASYQVLRKRATRVAAKHEISTQLQGCCSHNNHQCNSDKHPGSYTNQPHHKIPCEEAQSVKRWRLYLGSAAGPAVPAAVLAAGRALCLFSSCPLRTLLVTAVRVVSAPAIVAEGRISPGTSSRGG